MPELPEVETVANGVNARVRGQRITRVWTSGKPQTFKSAEEEIAEALARGLKVPAVSLSQEQAASHFGFLAMFAGADLAASSAKTRKQLGWQPAGPGLLFDLGRMDYSAERPI